MASVGMGLQAVELQEQQHVRADALSGGMKRRLQVALALLGSSRVILLGKALYLQALHSHDHHLMQPSIISIHCQHDLQGITRLPAAETSMWMR